VPARASVGAGQVKLHWVASAWLPVPAWGAADSRGDGLQTSRDRRCRKTRKWHG